MIAELWQYWKPVKDSNPEEQAKLISEIMKTLSVYGFGALPSDPLQSHAKIDGFREVLEECPFWAIELSGKNWRRDKTEPPVPASWLRATKNEMGCNDRLPWGRNEFSGLFDIGWAYEKVIQWMKNDKQEGNNK